MVPKASIWSVWGAQVAKWFKIIPKATIWTVWAAKVVKWSKMEVGLKPRADFI